RASDLLPERLKIRPACALCAGPMDIAKMRKFACVSATALAMAASPWPAFAQQPFEDPLRDVIVVTGAGLLSETTLDQSPSEAPMGGGDASELMTRVPGGARNGNGALSGQVQYRGLFGARINVQVDGHGFATGGPSMMDPPLHYAPLPLLQSLEIERGASPVSSGPGLGGGVNAVFKRVDFGAGPEVELHHDLTVQARSVDESHAAGGIAGLATDSLRFNLLASYEEGGDTEFPGGTIRDTAFERGLYGFSTGARFGAHEVGMDFRRQTTGPTGN